MALLKMSMCSVTVTQTLIYELIYEW